MLNATVFNLTRNSSRKFYRNIGDPSLIRVLINTAEASKWMLVVSVVLGILGNLIALIVYLKQRRLPVFKKLILHLSACDLIYCCVMVTSIDRRFRNHEWVFGGALCKLTLIAQSSLTCSMFTVTIIAIERYRTLMSFFSSKWKRSTICIILIVLWAISLLLHLPFFIRKRVVEYHGKQDCTTVWKSDEKDLKKFCDLAVFIVTYPIPLTIIIFCYARIGYRALKGFFFRNTENSGKIVKSSIKRNHGLYANFRVYRKLIFMLLLVLCFFVLTTTPNHALILWMDFAPRRGVSIDEKRRSFITLLIFSSLVYLHVWINPLLYTLADKKNRRVLLGFFHELFQQFCQLYRRVRCLGKSSDDKKDTRETLLSRKHSLYMMKARSFGGGQTNSTHSPCQRKDSTPVHSEPKNGANLKSQQIAETTV